MGGGKFTRRLSLDTAGFDRTLNFSLISSWPEANEPEVFRSWRILNFVSPSFTHFPKNS